MSGSKYEGCGEIGDIRAVFLSQFHPDQGPMIRCQWPTDFLSKENFDSVSSFIIPKNELQAHTITVNCLGYKISGYPTYLHDRKYRRNYLLFNFCIVSYPWSKTVQFEPIVRKLSQFFINLEKESSILHLSGSDNDIKEEARLERMLEQVYNDLNTESRCVVECGQNSLQLCVSSSGHDPPHVQPHHVPVLVTGQPGDHSSGGQEWDLTTTQILPHIDGFNHIAKIARLADVGTSLVRACVQNLVYHKVKEKIILLLIRPFKLKSEKVVELTSIFQYSNVYTVTPDLAVLRSDKQFRLDLLASVTRRDSLGPAPTFRDVYTFVSSFTYGTTVRDLCQRLNPAKMGIDESRLIQLCVMRGVLRRVHKYPVWTGSASEDGETSGLDTRLLAMMTGEHSTDQICVAAGISATNLEKRIEDDNSIIVIWK